MIGYGAPTKQGKASTHGEPLGAEEIKGAREKLGWPHAAFEVPDDVLAAWRGGRRARQRAAQGLGAARGQARCAQAGELARPIDAAAPQAARRGDRRHQGRVRRRAAQVATRVASQMVLEKLVPALPEPDRRLGRPHRLEQHAHQASHAGRAAAISRGNYIHYGVREHGMAAAMNGMALHGGVMPYGGTFLVFTDYCRPAIRLSALMGQRVIYVMTHDSIGLGEDGPTHQPVEHLAALRAMPEPQRVPPGRRRRDGRVLGAGAAAQRHAVDPGADAAGGAGAAQRHGGREPVRQGRLRAGRGAAASAT